MPRPDGRPSPEELEAITEGVCQAFLLALGAEGDQYPLTSERLHRTIARAIQAAVTKGEKK